MEQVHLLPVMKSTKVQNPRRILRYYANARERKLGTPGMHCVRGHPPGVFGQNYTHAHYF